MKNEWNPLTGILSCLWFLLLGYCTGKGWWFG